MAARTLLRIGDRGRGISHMKVVVVLILLAVVGCGAASPGPGGSPLGEAELKFAVMDAVGKPQWCDPDYWPIVREGAEQQNAVARYAEIKADATTYAAIIAHEHLPSGELNDAEKLVVYKAWKLLRPVELKQSGSIYAFAYTVMTKDGYQMVAGKVRVDGAVTVDSRTPAGAPNCPICLAASTLIDTPNGSVPVVDIRVGSVVWTEDGSGRRIAQRVASVGSMAAPDGHRMVHLRLADRRELFASPGHRTSDGRALGSLHVGDSLDGSRVTLWELVPYQGDRTYDLRPEGPTGDYWANGILLASTLA